MGSEQSRERRRQEIVWKRKHVCDESHVVTGLLRGLHTVRYRHRVVSVPAERPLAGARGPGQPLGSAGELTQWVRLDAALGALATGPVRGSRVTQCSTGAWGVLERRLCRR